MVFHNSWLARFIVLVLLLPAFLETAEAEEPRCTGSDLTTAQGAMKDAEKALDGAIVALQQPTGDLPAQLEKWLGVRSSAEAKAVLEKLTRTRAFTTGALFLCAVKTDAKIGDVYAYVRPDKSFAIVLTRYFFAAPDKGFSSKLGILVHEMTHFLLAGQTKDPKIYGPEEAKALSKSNPSAAQSNAENYEYFIEALAFRL